MHLLNCRYRFWHSLLIGETVGHRNFDFFSFNGLSWQKTVYFSSGFSFIGASSKFK